MCYKGMKTAEKPSEEISNNRKALPPLLLFAPGLQEVITTDISSSATSDS